MVNTLHPLRCVLPIYVVVPRVRASRILLPLTIESMSRMTTSFRTLIKTMLGFYLVLSAYLSV